MCKNLAKFGGDIIKFVGDAMIVMWPRSHYNKDDPDSNDEEEKVTVVRKAIQCACDIQKEMNNKKIMADVTNLSVKIGIAFGKCALLYVGGVFDRSEFFTVGPALTYALKSEEQATAGGQILVSETAFKYVKNQFYEGEEIVSDENKKFYRVTGVKVGVRGRADAVLLKSQIKFDRIAGIQKNLKSCVPAAIMPYLEIGYE
jgi:class 3 adenylate cyclase